MRKSQALQAKLILEFKDDPIRYERLFNMLVMALEMAEMDKAESKAYQEKILENL